MRILPVQTPPVKPTREHGIWRAVRVAIAGLISYVLLAFPIYAWLYANAADSMRFAITFYLAYSIHLLLTLGVTVYLALLTRVPVRLVLVSTVVFLAALAIPTLGILSFENVCRTSESFPFHGMAC